MARGVKKVLLYGSLLAAGAALGMQLVSGGDPAGGYTAQAGSLQGTLSSGVAAASQGAPAASAPVQPGSGTSAAGSGYEQGTYVKLPNGTTYYYVQTPAQQQGQGSLPASAQLPQVAGGSAGESGNTAGVPQYQSPGQLLMSPAPQTSVDRFADKTGELLQNVSQKSINWVVSLFGSLTE
ncbi:hypothetical protein AWM70_11710 [Paenibacillus yonginensis]|uniref:Uncharacterized protein n=1 Tax=Paenibacillus yonginensis TaxID=1462996 RepID=A0A1B1N1A1_9BACL|nr:hypothetical protein [Paenibacillus yonginensis]ANS75186.1 hypothetical protein AWM70_11710 [Paenibacillus yonginensis]